MVSYILSLFFVSRRSINLVCYYILAGSGSVNSKLHFNVESSLVLFSIFFFLDSRYNVDIWEMTIARHGEKLEEMS